MRTLPWVAFAAAVVLILQNQKAPGQDKTQALAPYFPTPVAIVEKMLQLGELKAGEKMFDLGSGDGRIVFVAAQKYKADSTGVEFDDSLWRQSSDRIKTLGLTSTARIIHGDLLKQDYSSADLITVYLLPVGNELVTPMLEQQLKKGARIVAHDFQFAAWKAEKTVDIDDDGEGRSHRLYLYRR
jgi:protein-L-isoaspartate O-methyltransferase